MRARLTIRCVAMLVLLASIAGMPGGDARAAGRNQLFEEFLQTQDPERSIALGAKILAGDASSEGWTLAEPREKVLAEVHSGLGRAYVNRTQGMRADNIEMAIENFTKALSLVPSASAEDAAAIHTNLGVAYWNRIRGERVDSEVRALSHFETALATYTREAFPLQWAQINTNVAALLLTRLSGDRAANIEDSISRLEGALAILQQNREPQLWAAAHSNLGNALRSRRTAKKAETLAAARDHFESSLKVFTRSAAPFQWAQVQVSIAAIMRQSGAAGDEDAAIARLEDVLSVFSRDAFPQQWAQTQYELGNALSDRTSGDRGPDRRRAMGAYQSALKVMTLEAYPLNRLQASRRLANLQMLEGDCAGAAVHHANARQAFLLLFGQQLETVEAAGLVAEAGPMFADYAYCAVERGHVAEAVKLSNEGRARLLSLSLKVHTLDLPAGDRRRLDDLRAAVRAAQAAVEQASGADRVAAQDRLAAVRRDLLGVVEGAPMPDGGLGPKELSEITGRTGAIVVPIITTNGAKVLLFSGRSQSWTSLDFPDVTLPRIAEILAGDGSSAGWIEAYFANYFDAGERELRWPKWLAAVDDIGPKLWTLFGQRLSLELKSNGVEDGGRLVLMPSGRLGVLPLGLAQDPVSQRRLIDSYELVYAPSLDALGSARQLVARAPAPTLAAVVNPTGDLPGTEKEGAIVASYFTEGSRDVLTGRDASVTAVLQALKGKSYWHFASHGTFDWQDVGSSALVMSGDERLSVARISDADDLGRPRLVILSACETGLSDIVTANPDEFVGLSGAFVGLGAAGVVGTLWPVSDDATALLIAKFYELHLKAHLAPSAALRRAQLWLRDATADQLELYARPQRLEARHADALKQTLDRLQRASSTSRNAATVNATTSSGNVQRPYAHPYYWGGFVYTGL